MMSLAIMHTLRRQQPSDEGVSAFATREENAT